MIRTRVITSETLNVLICIAMVVAVAFVSWYNKLLTLKLPRTTPELKKALRYVYAFAGPRDIDLVSPIRIPRLLVSEQVNVQLLWSNSR